MTPREVAAMLGVRASTVALWARLGSLKPAVRTPGGHRRYFRGDVLAFRDTYRSPEPDAAHEEMMRDAVRLYEQGWPIRRVAEEFGFGYGRMRRALLARTALRGSLARRPDA
ncbi:MerR family DNA-binding transcriptional regulator [Actinoallomurus sp. NBC_01490]